MKKAITAIIAGVMCLSMTVTAFAADTVINQDSADKTGKTTLSTFKPAAYTVVIPESAEIEFDAETTDIGDITYQQGNLEPGASVEVALTEATPLANTKDSQYTIDYTVTCLGEEFDGVVYEEDTYPGTVTPLDVNITNEAWENAKAGDYSALLTFEISYVNA